MKLETIFIVSSVVILSVILGMAFQIALRLDTMADNQRILVDNFNVINQNQNITNSNLIKLEEDVILLNQNLKLIYEK